VVVFALLLSGLAVSMLIWHSVKCKGKIDGSYQSKTRGLGLLSFDATYRDCRPSILLPPRVALLPFLASVFQYVNHRRKKNDER